MRYYILIAFTLMMSLVANANAQSEIHLRRLENKKVWTFSIEDGLYGIEGEFAGINGNVMQVRDADGVKYEIPINNLIEEDKRLFWEFDGSRPSIGMPGKHAKLVMENKLFADYQDRLTERRVYALKVRAEIASRKPPARGWLAIRVPYNFADPLGVMNNGFVIQPSIPYGRYGYRQRLPIYYSDSFYSCRDGY